MQPGTRVDSTVTIPAAIRAAGQRADELIKARSQSTPPADEAVTTESKPAPEATTEATIESKSEPAPEPMPIPEPKPQEQDWRRQYLAMEGRFKQEQENTRRMAAQLSEMQNVIATMKVAPVAPVAPAKHITPEQEKEWGGDFLDVVGKRSREVVDGEVASLKAELAAMRQQMSGMSTALVGDARQKMTATLSQAVPNWDEINRSPEFMSWLNLPDAYTGAIRLDLLKAAFQANQTSRVVAFFQGFLADEAATRPAPSPAPSPAPKPRVDLRSLAAPGRATQQAVTQPVEKPSFTRAEVTAFYADVRKGAYMGREAEKDRLEGLIFEAGRDGRIQ